MSTFNTSPFNTNPFNDPSGLFPYWLIGEYVAVPVDDDTDPFGVDPNAVVAVDDDSDPFGVDPDAVVVLTF